MAGIEPHVVTVAANRAAPVGVVSSATTSVPWMGAPDNRAMVAGAGTGIVPWADSTEPVPVATLAEPTSSMSSTSRAAQVPTTSTMLSIAPNSWKYTSSGGIPWRRPSTAARASKVSRTRRAIRSGKSAASTMARISRAGRWVASSSAVTRTSIAAIPPRRQGSAVSAQQDAGRPPTGRRLIRARTSSTSAPASTRAPRAMSPAMPENGWNHATRVMPTLLSRWSRQQHPTDPRPRPACGAPHRPRRTRCRSPPRSNRKRTRRASPAGR